MLKVFENIFEYCVWIFMVSFLDLSWTRWWNGILFGYDDIFMDISSYSMTQILGKGIIDSIQGGGHLAMLQYMKDGSTGPFVGYGISLKRLRYLKVEPYILYEFFNVDKGVETKTSPRHKPSMGSMLFQVVQVL